MANFDIPVAHYMSSPVFTADPNESVEQVYHRLAELGVSSLAVVSDDLIVGVISRTDLLQVGRRDAGSRAKAALLTFPNQPIKQLMTLNVVAVAPDDLLSTVARKMVEYSLHRIFVTKDEQVVGVVSPHDLMAAIRDKGVGIPIAEYMSSPLFTVRADEPISLATERLEKAHVTGIVVVEEGWPIGIFTQVEALASRMLPRDTCVDQVMDSALLCMPTSTRMNRAAALATRMRARRIVAAEHRTMEGILTGIDFARLVAGGR